LLHFNHRSATLHSSKQQLKAKEGVNQFDQSEQLLTSDHGLSEISDVVKQSWRTQRQLDYKAETNREVHPAISNSRIIRPFSTVSVYNGRQTVTASLHMKPIPFFYHVQLSRILFLFLSLSLSSSVFLLTTLSSLLSFVGRNASNILRAHFDGATKAGGGICFSTKSRTVRMLSAGIACCRIKRSRFHGQSIKRSTVERTPLLDPMGPSVMSAQSSARPSSLPVFICVRAHPACATGALDPLRVNFHKYQTIHRRIVAPLRY